MIQKILVKLAQSNRVMPLDEYLLTKLVFPISYKDVECRERDLISLARRHKRYDIYLVINSNSKALRGLTVSEDPFIPNTCYVYNESVE